MGRKPRHEAPGRIYHCFTRRIERGLLYPARDDYERFVRELGTSVERCGWICLAFCLMPTHFHLFIETPEPNLAKGMHRLLSMYARWYNDRYARNGPLFEHRYEAIAVETDDYFVQLAAYIGLNPVRKGLCARPEEWPWSSRGLVGSGIAPRWLADRELLDRLEVLTGRDDFFELLSP